MLMDTGGWAWLIYTPDGRNWIFNEHELARTGQVDDSVAWRAPSLGAEIRDGELIRVPHPLENPFIPWTELQHLYNTMPERAFRQEILAEFLEDAGGVFRGVAAVSILEPTEPEQDHMYVVGADWGQSDDYTVFSVLDVTKRPVRQVCMERSNLVGYQLQLGRLERLIHRYDPLVVSAELNSIGTPLVEQLQAAGYPVEPFITTNASKKEAIEALALGIERKDVLLLKDETQLDEMESYTSERLPSGLMRYGAPEGQHDDTVMALALAWQYAKNNYDLSTPDETEEERERREWQESLRKFGGRQYAPKPGRGDPRRKPGR